MPSEMPRVVIIESPYFGNPEACRYLACCLLDSILRGEAPIASHCTYPLALGELSERLTGAVGRAVGLSLRAAWSKLYQHVETDDDGTKVMSELPVLNYVDLGVSAGMPEANRRNLQGEALRIWQAGEWPTPARLTANHPIAKPVDHLLASKPFGDGKISFYGGPALSKVAHSPDDPKKCYCALKVVGDEVLEAKTNNALDLILEHTPMVLIKLETSFDWTIVHIWFKTSQVPALGPGFENVTWRALDDVPGGVTAFDAKP